MGVRIVLGLQWGDEGKGHIVDLLAEQADIVARFNGGNNAGHTVVNPLGVFKMHLLPCGIFNPHALNVIGGGVLVDGPTLVKEIREVQQRGIDLTDRLLISPRAHLIMPYHRILDRLYEEAKGTGSTGTTGRGIGPAMADKVSYNGIRVSDLSDPAYLAERLDVQLNLKNRIITALGGEPVDRDALLRELQEIHAELKPFTGESFYRIQDAMRDGKQILLEGANATLLDPDWGTYPFVTASNTLSSAVTGGLGVAFTRIDEIVGVAKAFTTRVGNGPLPTEIFDETAKMLREGGPEIGWEYGTTTGRPRRVGWFDAALVRFAATINGCKQIALTKLDILDNFPTIKLARAYRYCPTGQEVGYADGETRFLEQCEPIYEELPGWQTSLADVRRPADLPAATRRYIERIEELSGVRVAFISVGPQRDQVIEMG